MVHLVAGGRFLGAPVLLAIAAAGFGVALLALAAPAEGQCAGGPANDCFASATVITSPHTSVESTVGATLEAGEPRPCGGTGSTVWFRWTPAFNGTATVDTNGPASDYDTVLAAYTGSSVGALANVACNDDFPTCCQSQITFTCVAGTTYSIQLGGFSSSSGTAQIALYGCQAPPVPSPPCFNAGPPNDCFDSGTPFAADSFADTGSNTGAVMESGEPVPCCGADRSIWWRWTPQTSGRATVDLCGSGYDTVAAAYTGSQVNQLTTLDFDDDSSCGLASLLEFPCSAGTTYHIQITGFSGATGAVQLMANCQPPCVPPAPANDCFNDATVISTNANSIVQATANAQMEDGEPAACCSLGKSVWFRWTPTVNGVANLATCGSSFNTALAVYTGTALSSLSSVASNDNACGTQSMVTFACVAGTTYHVQVGSTSNGAAGTLRLDLTCAPPCASPANDCFATATVATGMSYATTQSTAGATMEPGEPVPCCGLARSVWFSWTPSATGEATVTTCGSTYNTALAAYTGSSLSALTLRALNDNACGLQSTITFPCTAGTTYRIQVSSASGGAPGLLRLAATCSPPLCGYQFEPMAGYDFVDLTGTGTGLRHTDNSFRDVTLPFTFKFCGLPYTAVRTSSNGYLCLGTTPGFSCSDPSPLSIPSTLNPRPAIFGYYTDLFATNCSSTTPTSCTSWQVLGSAPERVFVYMMKDVGFCCTTPPTPVSFEIKLFETTNCIEVHYAGVSDPGNRRAVAGFQNWRGTVGYTYADSTPGFARDATAWRACPPGPFDALNDAYVVNEDQAAQLLPVGANDNNEYGTVASFSLVSPPSRGTASLAPGGILYTPAPHATGTDTFQYRMADDQDHEDIATVTVQINPVNDAPVFALPSTRIVATLGPTPATIPGWATDVAPGPAAAVDEELQAIFFELASNSQPEIFTVPPSLVRTSSATAAAASPDAGAFGALHFQLGALGSSTVCFRARDNGGTGPSTNSWAFSVAGVDTSAPLCATIVANAPPVAYFRPATEGAAPGEPVTFDDCPGPVPLCTHDPDGILVQRLWEFGDGTSSALASPSHAFASPGVYRVRLTVWDDLGTESSHSVDVVVAWPHGGPAEDEEPRLDDPPVADAGPDQTVDEGTLVRLSGRERDGRAGVQLTWEQVAGPTVALESGGAETTFTAPRLASMEPATLRFRLRVADAAGDGVPDEVAVRVVSTNQAPDLEVPGILKAMPGAVVELAATATDADGDEVMLAWRQVHEPGAPIVRLSDPTSAGPTFTAPEPGMLRFAVTASDGRATVQDTVVVLVEAAPPPAAEPEPTPDIPQPPAQASQTAAKAPGIHFVLLGALGLGLVGLLLGLLVVRRMLGR